ncbi:Nephrocystin-3 [Trichoplax sp. H2]|nr:Nephrocystin-3 [Trichoplax sp. H2]|eukprot:RDD39303.1 Nephrocystin-3 [Trichoplax sp. H2]
MGIWTSKSTSFKEIQFKHESGRKCHKKGNYKLALTYYQQAAIQIESIPKISQDHVRLECDIYLDMANSFREKSELMEANKWRGKAEKLAKEIKDQKRISQCLDNQGDIKRLQGDLIGALSDYNKSLEMKLEFPEKEHVNVSESYCKIGVAYFDQGKYDKALDMYLKSLEINLKIDAKHPDTAALYGNIANIYIKQGKYDDALSMNSKALEVQLEKLGDNHPSVATTYSNTGQIYDHQGKYNDAISMYNKSLEIELKQLGDCHPSIATTYGNIASVYLNQSKYDDALSMYNKSLEIKKSQLDENHPSIATTYNNIGFVYDKQKKYDEALSMYDKASQVYLKTLGNNHPNTALSFRNQAHVHYRKSNYDQAILFYNKSITSLSNLYGKSHPQIARAKEKITQCNNQKQKNRKAAAIPQTSKMIHLPLQNDKINQSLIINLSTSTSEGNFCICMQNRNLSAIQYLHKVFLCIDNENDLICAEYNEYRATSGASSVSMKNEEDKAIKEFVEANFIYPLDKCYSVIKNKIADGWFQLARYLGLSVDDTGNLDRQDENSSHQSLLAISVQNLNYLQERILSQYSLSTLIASLYRLKRKETADILYEMLLQNQSNSLLSNYVAEILLDLSLENIIANFDGENDEDSKTIDNKEYLSAYDKALKIGKCRNDFTKIVIAGPENVGKTSIISAFINNGYITFTSETIIADEVKKLSNLIIFNMFDKTEADFRMILHKKVLIVIEQLKNTMNINNSNVQDEENSTYLLDQTDILIDNEETVINCQSMRKIEEDGSHMVTFTAKEPKMELVKNRMSKNINLNSSTAIPDNDIEPTRDSMPKPGDKIVIYEEFMRTLTGLKGKIEGDTDDRYGKLTDLGGQAIYYVAHRPFLSGNSLYILVFNILRDIDDAIIDRDNKPINMTYRQAMQEWLTSIIGSYDGQDKVNVTHNGIEIEYNLPVVILIASHGDQIIDEEERKRKFHTFTKSLTEAMPDYKYNICSSGIIFHCNCEDNTQTAIERRQNTNRDLHELIKQFATNRKFMRQSIPIRWYILASILHTSTDFKSRKAGAAISESPFGDIARRIRNIMTFDEIKQLATDCGLYEDDATLRSMLLYLRDIGEIVFCKKKGLDGMIVTNLDWLLRIFQSIIKIGDKTSKFMNSGIQDCFEMVYKTGKMPELCLNYATAEFKLNKTEKEFILQLMESYHIICKIESENCDDRNTAERQYFVPYLLRSSTELELADYYQSDWLYIGYDSVSYIPMGIFHCHLSACLKIWSNPQVEIYHRCAKYRLVDYPCEIIIKKIDCYIGLQFCYKIPAEDLIKDVAENVKRFIYDIKPHIMIKKKLKEVVSDRMPKLKSSKYRFYVKCSACKKLTKVITHLIGKTDAIKCSACCIYFQSKSVREWQIFEQEKLADQSQQSQEEHQTTLTSSRQGMFDLCFNIIAGKLKQDRLFHLEMLLGLTIQEIDEIRLNPEFHTPYEKTIRALLLWKEKAGSKPDIFKVVSVIREMNINTLADQIEAKIKDYANASEGSQVAMHS